jgi:hypothetical protein
MVMHSELSYIAQKVVMAYKKNDFKIHMKILKKIL